ncbi:MAG TPA: hypothetical protein VNU93_02425 [Verrucomicrobiae bacterium]|nr:hypothetical protein [Verrucomicrobiae bacterium]
MSDNDLINQIRIVRTVMQESNKTRNEIESNKLPFQFFTRVLSIGLFPVFIWLKWFMNWTFWHSVLGTLGFIILCIILEAGINSALKPKTMQKDADLKRHLTATLARLENSQVPESYRYFEALNAFEQYLVTNTAKTMGDCIELFEQDKKRRRLTA